MIIGSNSTLGTIKKKHNMCWEQVIPVQFIGHLIHNMDEFTHYYFLQHFDGKGKLHNIFQTSKLLNTLRVEIKRYSLLY